MRGQLRVLETIDRVIHKRKQERENEQTLRAAKSRSKGADPEKAAKIREEAKQVREWESGKERGGRKVYCSYRSNKMKLLEFVMRVRIVQL